MWIRSAPLIVITLTLVGTLHAVDASRLNEAMMKEEQRQDERRTFQKVDMASSTSTAVKSPTASKKGSKGPKKKSKGPKKESKGPKKTKSPMPTSMPTSMPTVAPCHNVLPPKAAAIISKLLSLIWYLIISQGCGHASRMRYITGMYFDEDIRLIDATNSSNITILAQGRVAVTNRLMPQFNKWCNRGSFVSWGALSGRFDQVNGYGQVQWLGNRIIPRQARRLGQRDEDDGEEDDGLEDMFDEIDDIDELRGGKSGGIGRRLYGVGRRIIGKLYDGCECRITEIMYMPRFNLRRMANQSDIDMYFQGPPQ